MLRTHGLSLKIAGRTLCAQLDVGFDAGQNWVILGANGSGKTTLLHALAGLRTPDQGEVTLAGHNIQTLGYRQRAQKIGVLFQDFDATFPATVFETVLSGRYPHLQRWQWETDADQRAVEQALATVALSDFAQRPLTTLSGGERRRVEIAALLAQDAPICLMDEPTNHLDLRYQAQIMQQLVQRSARAGHFNIFVLHDINLAARFGSHVILLFDNGEVLHGPLPQLFERSLLERLYHCPLREIRVADTCWYLPI
ncbi:MAG: ABC transporter ATP-binding protein [Gammaproteobacteria bacterium]|nr:ABC transporter ATP-binding protein [Gammaproteobacteria bacterium]